MTWAYARLGTHPPIIQSAVGVTAPLLHEDDGTSCRRTFAALDTFAFLAPSLRHGVFD